MKVNGSKRSWNMRLWNSDGEVPHFLGWLYQQLLGFCASDRRILAFLWAGNACSGRGSTTMAELEAYIRIHAC